MKLLSGFISYFSGFSKIVPAYLSGTDYFRSRIKQKKYEPKRKTYQYS